MAARPSVVKYHSVGEHASETQRVLLRALVLEAAQPPLLLLVPAADQREAVDGQEEVPRQHLGPRTRRTGSAAG